MNLKDSMKFGRILKTAAVCCIFVLAFSLSLQAADEIRVVATTRILGDFAAQILGRDAEIHAVAAPGRDIHFTQPTPKDVLKVKKADVFIHGGLDLEVWREPLLNAAGNGRFLGGGTRSIDASKRIALLEVPESLSRAQGDIHAFGNPHYWTDPENARKMAAAIAVRFTELYPERAQEIQNNAGALDAVLQRKEAEWEVQLAPFKGMAVIAYHRSWVYFAKRFGFEIAGYVEPKPGIPPTARHLGQLAQAGRQKHVRLVIKEAFQERRAAEKIARETGAVLVTLYQSAGEGGSRGYIEMMDKNVEIIIEALTKTGGA